MHLGRGPRRKAVLFSFFSAIQCICLLVLSSSPALSKRKHISYFPNTAYELNVYKIRGKNPGNTLMLIGGIQGNEPGGFLSADLYADMSLEKGNLIVVPRANFYSILMNHRGPHGDMNRKFSHKENSKSMEDKIVSILKTLIAESDYLLNLHDGSGYYYPTYIDKWRNPSRFGQSIIADCEAYVLPGSGRVLKLGDMARKVISEVNSHIRNDLYKFHFNNTMTDAPGSPHGEQKKSATYYALTKHHIPAFGVETSKFLPSIDLKVHHHKLVINTFMEMFGIIPENPGITLDTPALKYLVVSINQSSATVLKDKEALLLNAGDSIQVSHIEANYERGLSLDILGYGGLNDFRKDFTINRSTSIIVRKDNQKFAEIPIRISDRRVTGIVRHTPVSDRIYLVVEAGQQRILLADGETLDLVKGDQMKIVDILLPEYSCLEKLTVNFKGFVGNWENNTGEDRGYAIDTGSDLLRRYSRFEKGREYEILARQGENVIGRFMVRINSPKLEYMILQLNGSFQTVLRPGDTLFLRGSDEIRLEEIRINAGENKGLCLGINGNEIRPGETVKVHDLLKAGSEQEIQEAVVRQGKTILCRIPVSVLPLLKKSHRPLD